MSDDHTTDEHYRIFVPNPDCEVVMGHGPNGFIGIMNRVSNGGIFMGAGGFGFGMASFDSSYDGFRKAHTSLSIGINAVAIISQFMRAFQLGREANMLSVTVNSLAFGLGTMGATIGAATTNGLTSPEGTICLYGDKTVAAASPVSVTLTAGVAASLNGSVAASVNSIVSATVNGITAGVYGAYAATLSGTETRVVGDASARLSTRQGTTTVEGTVVNIGTPSGEMPGKAYSGFTTGGQDATERVEIRADSAISLSPGGDLDRVRGTNTKFVATKSDLHMQASGSAVTIDDNVLVRSGGAAMVVTPSRLRLFASALPLGETFKAAVKTAETAWKFDNKFADLIEEQVSNKTKIALAATVAGAAIAAPVAATQLKGSVGAKVGIGVGAAAAGAIFGAAAAVGVIAAVQSKLTQAARDAKRLIADTTYKAVVDGMKATVAQAAQTAAALPTTPQVDVSTSSVTMKVGLSMVRVNPTGIVIESPPGTDVTVNGQKFTNLIPGLFEVG